MQPCNKFLCSIISTGAQQFDFTKSTVIWKLAYEVKSISQINGGFVFWKFKNKILLNLLVQLRKQYDENQYKKKECNQHSSVFKLFRKENFHII